MEGERAYASVLDYPGTIDEATLYVPPAVGVSLLPEIARKGIRTVWLNPGADGADVVSRARELGLQPDCRVFHPGDRGYAVPFLMSWANGASRLCL